MKLVYVIFDSGVLPDVLEVMDDQGITGWTRFPEIPGAGERNRREGTPVYPGINEVLVLALEEEKVQPLIDRCHEVRDSFPLKPGMRFIITDCQII